MTNIPVRWMVGVRATILAQIFAQNWKRTPGHTRHTHSTAINVCIGAEICAVMMGLVLVHTHMEMHRDVQISDGSVVVVHSLFVNICDLRCAVCGLR